VETTKSFSAELFQSGLPLASASISQIKSIYASLSLSLTFANEHNYIGYWIWRIKMLALKTVDFILMPM